MIDMYISRNQTVKIHNDTEFNNYRNYFNEEAEEFKYLVQRMLNIYNNIEENISAIELIHLTIDDLYVALNKENKLNIARNADEIARYIDYHEYCDDPEDLLIENNWLKVMSVFQDKYGSRWSSELDNLRKLIWKREELKNPEGEYEESSLTHEVYDLQCVEKCEMNYPTNLLFGYLSNDDLNENSGQYVINTLATYADDAALAVKLLDRQNVLYKEAEKEKRRLEKERIIEERLAIIQKGIDGVVNLVKNTTKTGLNYLYDCGCMADENTVSDEALNNIDNLIRAIDGQNDYEDEY